MRTRHADTTNGYTDIRWISSPHHPDVCHYCPCLSTKPRAQMAPFLFCPFRGKIRENTNHLKCLLHVGIERKLSREPGNTHKLINTLAFKCSVAPGCIALVPVRSLTRQRRYEGSLKMNRETGWQHKYTQHISTKLQTVGCDH